MAQGIGGFVKQNAAIGGVLGAGLGVAQIAGSESKLKGIASVLAQILTFKAGLAAMFVGTFSKAKDSMSNLIKESGSLDAALRRIGKAAEDAGNAYAKAKEKMKAGAGAAWAESEITNTKNMTRAVEAMTPAVTAASNSWAKLTGGLSTARSEIIRAAAESGVLSGAITTLSNGLMALSIGATAIATPILTKWLFGLGAASQVSSAALAGMTGTAMRSSTVLNALSRATGISRAAYASFGASVLRVGGALARLSGIGLVASAIFAGVGAVWSYVKAWQEAATAANRMLDTSLDLTKSINAQISNIKTATDQATTYANALNVLSKAQQQLNDVRAQGARFDNDPKLMAAKTAVAVAEADVRRAAVATPTEGPGSGTEEAVAKARSSRDKSDAELNDKIANASEEDRPALLLQKALTEATRAEIGMKEIKGRDETKKQLDAIDMEDNREKDPLTDEIKRDKDGNEIGRNVGVSGGTTKQKERARKIAILENKLSTGDTSQGTGIPEFDKGPGAIPLNKEAIQDKLKQLRDERDSGRDRYDPEIYEKKRSEAREKSDSFAVQLEGQNIKKQKHRTPENDSDTQREITDNAVDIALANDMASGAGQSAIAAQSAIAEAGRGDLRVSEAKALLDIEADIAKAKEEGYDMSVKEAQAQREQLYIQMAYAAAKHGPDSQEVKQAQVKIDQIDKASAIRKREHESEMRQNQASLATSGIRGEGYEVEKEKDRIERERLVAEEAAAVGDEAKMKAKTALQAHDTMRSGKEVEQYESKEALNDEWRRNRAQARGDSARVTELDDFEEFRKNFDARKGVMGLDTAKDDAIDMATNTITLRAQNDMNSSNAGVASASMARIGGGGGIGPGATSMIDLQKRTNDLLESADKHLAVIKAKRDGIPAN